jgi:ribosomal protein S18 acetylase RimI-like enzyme
MRSNRTQGDHTIRKEKAMTTITIRKATSADVDHLVPHLARAFDNDPLVNWFVRQDDKRAYGFDVLFRTCLCRLSLPHGEVLTTDDCFGGALWYPPGKSKIGFTRQLFLLPAMIRVASLRRLKRLIDTLDTSDKIHPTERHYYLQFISVDPDHKGKGLGTALMQPVLKRCDHEGCGAYLENTAEVNLAFYERQGFAVVDEVDLGQGAPPFWPMWRDPQWVP